MGADLRRYSEVSTDAERRHEIVRVDDIATRNGVTVDEDVLEIFAMATAFPEELEGGQHLVE